MGVVHKLKPEIKKFILEQKKNDKNLSCRKIAALVYAQFKFKLSKSSVNSILKQAGFSMPVGRRPKPGSKKVSAKLKEAPSKGLVTSVRCIKAGLSDGSSFYFDGQMHTVWHSAAQIPEAFSTTKRPELNVDPVVLFFAPGYDIPTGELLKFILSFVSPQIKISQFIFYDKELRELEKIDISVFSRHFALGIWPWQFKEYIKVKVATESHKMGQELNSGPIFVAEAKFELASPKKEGEVIKFRGCALKARKGTVLAGNRPFIILSNFTSQEMPLNELANLYLKRWPNPEETLQDFSRKVEEFRKRFL